MSTRAQQIIGREGETATLFGTSSVKSKVMLLLCAVLPKNEDRGVEKMFEKSVELYGDLIKKLLAEASN